MDIKARNNVINKSIQSKFGTSLANLDKNPKALHQLNHKGLYTPKELTNRIGSRYSGQIAKQQKNIKKYSQNLKISAEEHLGLSVDDQDHLKEAKMNLHMLNNGKKMAMKPLDNVKGVGLIHKDGFNFTPATAKQLGSVKGIKGLKPAIEVGHNPGNPMNPASRGHAQYMKIRGNQNKLTKHRASARAFDNSESHRLGNKVWYIKKNMSKPRSKYYAGKFVKKGQSIKDVKPMDILYQLKLKQKPTHHAHKIQKVQAKQQTAKPKAHKLSFKSMKPTHKSHQLSFGDMKPQKSTKQIFKGLHLDGPQI